MKEREYLRNEVNSRIMLTYTHSNTTMTFVITIWSILITLISFLYKSVADYDFIIFMLAPVIVLITLFYILFASYKYRENLHQIIKICSYYACFYNEPGIPSDEIDSWELITMDMKDDKQYALNPKHKVLPGVNGEYVFFAAVACAINFVLFVLSFAIFYERASFVYLIVSSVEYILILVVSVLLLVKIANNTSLKKYHEEHATMFTAWIRYVIERGYLTKEQALKKYEKLSNHILEHIRRI